MNKLGLQLIFAALIVLMGSTSALAEPHTPEDLYRNGDIVVDHQPRRFGGTASDTLFYDYYGFEVWQQLADDFLLDSSVTIRRASWWGFYHLNEPPPVVETMRIRFYDARPSDGLPGTVLYEETLLNPSRTATGEIVSSYRPLAYFSAGNAHPGNIDACAYSTSKCSSRLLAPQR
ncbi:MAG: hypothetical protein ABII12_02885 [Planctomycetota bacterium]